MAVQLDDSPHTITSMPKAPDSKAKGRAAHPGGDRAGHPGATGRLYWGDQFAIWFWLGSAAILVSLVVYSTVASLLRF
jgi:hypothetical protein